MGMNLPQSDGGEGNDDLMPMAEINVTPFVDVMLVLLIIFMVAAPLMMSGVGVKLPQTAAARQQPPQKPLVVTVAPGEKLYIRDDPVTREGLTDRLAALHNAEGDATAYIRADESIPYGAVMEILGEVSAAGYASISLLSQTKNAAAE